MVVCLFFVVFSRRKRFSRTPVFFFFDLFHIKNNARETPSQSIHQSSSRAQTTQRRNSFIFFSFFFFPSLFHLLSKQRRFSCLCSRLLLTRRHLNEHPKERSASKKETNCILPPGVDMSRHGRYSVSFTLSLARSLALSRLRGSFRSSFRWRALSVSNCPKVAFV